MMTRAQRATITRMRRDDAMRSLAEWVALAIALLWVMVIAAYLTSCNATPRHALRGGVLTMAHAARQLDHACADYSRAAKDLALADACAASYNVTRDALLTAESALDAWSDADQGRAICAAAKGASSLASGISMASKAGAKMPPAVVDGAEVARVLAKGVCR